MRLAADLDAFATRIGIGGVGTVAGVMGMSISGLAGMIWSRQTAHLEHRHLGVLFVLALCMSTHLISGLAVPREMAIWFFTVAAGPIFAVNLVAVPLIGALLERENRRMKEERRLAAAAVHRAAARSCD